MQGFRASHFTASLGAVVLSGLFSKPQKFRTSETQNFEIFNF